MTYRFVSLVFLACFASLAAAQSFSGEFRSDVQGPPYPWTHRNFPDEKDLLRFAVVSDRTGDPRPGVLERAVAMLNLLQPEFVLSVGDLADNPSDETSASECDREHQILDDIVGKLKMPFFYVAGNHDIYNSLAAERYRARHGRPYYYFVYKNVLFLVLCTEDPPPGGTFSAEQIAWARQALQENTKVRWTFVFLHKPLFHPREAADHPGWKQIEEALGERPYTVFAGHWHQYTPCRKKGRRLIILSTTGGASSLTGPQKGQMDHIVWVTMTPDTTEPTMVNLVLPAILSWDYLPPACLDPQEPAPKKKASAAAVSAPASAPNDTKKKK